MTDPQMYADLDYLRDALRTADAERDLLRKALERVLVEEINGRLCPLPETDEEWEKLRLRCPSCAETWRQVQAALDGPEEREDG